MTKVTRRTVLALLSVLSFAVPSFAEKRDTFYVDGFKYIVENATTVAISDAGPDAPIPMSEDSTLTIPSVVEFEGRTYNVDRIYWEAFALRQKIKHLVIGEGVKFIDQYAFYMCMGLTSVHLPSTYTGWIDRGEFLIGCCNLNRITIDERNYTYDSRDECNAIILTEDSTLVFGCLGTRIPATVTTIGPGAFRQCLKLESITVPEGVRIIEPCAFRNCANLKEVSLPNSLEGIGYSAFSDCMSLETITIPQNVSQIRGNDFYGKMLDPYNLFGGCHNLKEVRVDKRNRTFDSRSNCNALIDTSRDMIVAACGNTVIPDGIKGIGAYAFTDISIPDIRIPKSVQTIEPDAFWRCTFCSSVSVDAGNKAYNSKDNCNAIIETATGKLIHGCSTTRIPDNVREIGDGAFYGVRLPPLLIIPEGVETIGEHAFTRDCGLEYVKMPSTLKLIKNDAFGCCDGIRYIDMSRCSPKIEMFAFSQCEYLYLVDFSPTIGEIHELAFSHCYCEAWVKKLVERSK